MTNLFKGVEEIILEEITVTPKSLSQLYRLLREKYNFNKSIQALFKILKVLISEGKIIRKDKKYQTSKTWILENKKYFDFIYQKVSRHEKLNVNLNKNYEIYTFDTLFDLDNFWNDAINQITINSESKHIFVKSNYYWWFLLNMNYELLLWRSLNKKGTKIEFKIIRDNKINKWASKILNESGFKCEVIDGKGEEFSDWNIFEDTIIQVTYDVKIQKIIKNIFENNNLIEDIETKKLLDLSTSKGSFQIKIIKDKSLADQIKKEFRKY